MRSRFDRFETWATQTLTDHEERLNVLSSSFSLRTLRASAQAHNASHRGPGSVPPRNYMFDFDEIEDKEKRLTSVSLGAESYLETGVAPTSPRRANPLTPAANVIIRNEDGDDTAERTPNIPTAECTKLLTQDVPDTLAQLDTNVREMIPAVNYDTTNIDALKPKTAGTHASLQLLDTRVAKIEDAIADLKQIENNVRELREQHQISMALVQKNSCTFHSGS